MKTLFVSLCMTCSVVMASPPSSSHSSSPKMLGTGRPSQYHSTPAKISSHSHTHVNPPSTPPAAKQAFAPPGTTKMTTNPSGSTVYSSNQSGYLGQSTPNKAGGETYIDKKGYAGQSVKVGKQPSRYIYMPKSGGYRKAKDGE